MIYIYVFVAFLFFKIFPEFADYRANSALGAVVMAVTSAGIVKAAEVAVAWRMGVWLQTERKDDRDRPTGILLAIGLGIVVSVASTYLIAVGFSPQLFRSAFQGYRSSSSEFWLMAAIPPFCHFAILAPNYLKAVNVMKAARRG